MAQPRIRRWHNLRNTVASKCSLTGVAVSVITFLVTFYTIYNTLDSTNKKIITKINSQSQSSYILKPDLVETASKLTIFQNNDAQQQQSKKLINPINVHVIEEHHEVLPIWYDTWSRSSDINNPFTLLHVDGHSDQAPLLLDVRFPRMLDKRKLKHKHIRLLATSNDAFIMAAEYLGIVSNVMWLEPSWTNSSKTMSDLHEFEAFSIGVTKLNSKLAMCTCPLYFRNQTVSKKSENNSYFQKCHTVIKNKAYKKLLRKVKITAESHVNQNSNASMVLMYNKALCKHKKGPNLHAIQHEKAGITNIHQQVFSEYGFDSEYFNSKIPSSKINQFILDIDEDYFGVELPATATVKIISKETIITLKKFLRNRKIFQAHNGFEEMENDNLFAKIIISIINQKHIVCRNSDDKSERCYKKMITKIPFKSILLKLKIIQKEKFRRLEIRHDLASFVRYLIGNFDQHQLIALIKMGICFPMSPFTNFYVENSIKREVSKTIPRRPLIPLTLCTGHNKPWESIVEEFVDTDFGIEKRVSRLKHLLKSLPTDPKLITLVRSTRDGYTPRHQQLRIEKAIIEMLKELFSEKLGTVVYHHDLMYGAAGWLQQKENQLNSIQV